MKRQMRIVARQSTMIVIKQQRRTNAIALDLQYLRLNELEVLQLARAMGQIVPPAAQRRLL